MNRMACLAGAIALTLALAGCNGVQASAGSGSGAPADAQPTKQVKIKESTDPHVWYVKNYVGMNAASVGYTALDGSRRDAYGAGTLKIVYKTDDGSYVDYAEDEDGNVPEELKNYVVVGQNLKPNTEIDYTFLLDENGEEYDNLINVQSYDEIVLAVAPVGSNDDAPKLTAIDSSPDKYTRYVKDYVGRNLATCGYESLMGTFNDSYGQGYITFDITAEDGSYVDVSDIEALKQYVVTGQNVEPNTAITMTFSTDENGREYDNLVDSQNIERINLTVKKLSE